MYILFWPVFFLGCIYLLWSIRFFYLTRKMSRFIATHEFFESAWLGRSHQGRVVKNYSNYFKSLWIAQNPTTLEPFCYICGIVLMKDDQVVTHIIQVCHLGCYRNSPHLPEVKF